MTAAADAVGYKLAFGTSFACPLIAGYAAILKQKYPELTASELFKMIEEDGNLYPNYDYAHGYGVPQFNRHTTRNDTTATFTVTAIDRELELELLTEPGEFTEDIIYFQWFDFKGDLISYNARKTKPKGTKFSIQPESKSEAIVKITYQGYHQTIKL